MRTVIYGPYKTGTTALFYRLKEALPLGTRTLFEPRQYTPEAEDARQGVLAKVILAAPEPGRAAVDYESFVAFEKKVVLVRDPRDWLISGLLFVTQQLPALYRNADRLAAFLDLLQQKERAPHQVPLLDLFGCIALEGRGSIEAERSWMIRQFSWLSSFESMLQDHHLLRYEDMVDRRFEALETYLGIPMPENAPVATEYQHVIRSRGYDHWPHWFTPADVAFFRPIFDPYIRYYGYPPAWDLHPHPVIDPAHSSVYVRRIVDLRLRLEAR